MVASFSSGIPQLLVRHGLLDQLPGEPRDLKVLEQEHGSGLPQRGALLLKLALFLLPN
jgi:hypothetical protein